MSVLVRIPTVLRNLTGGKGEVWIDGNTVRDLIENLEKEYPGIRERICEEEGDIHRFVNIYVAQEDIRFLQGLDTSIEQGTEVSIVPALAGG